MEDDADNEKSAASTKSSKSIKSLTKTMKALEKDNQRLKKSVSMLQKCNEDDNNDSSLSSVEESTHFQEAVETRSDSYPKIALVLKSKKSMGLAKLDIRNVLLLYNQSTFDLCCNRKFVSSVKTALNALNTTSNGGDLRISEKCKLPGYKFWVWLSKKAITNIICLKNLIKIYRVTYNSEVDTVFVVHHTQFSLPDLFFEMHPCGLHVCYPQKMGEFGFIQTVRAPHGARAYP